MKIKVVLLIFLIASSYSFAQKKLSLPTPDSVKLLKLFEDNNYQINIIDTYFQQHFKDLSGKQNILLDPDFNNKECGFTRNYELGIVYSFDECGEASGVRENISFPPHIDLRSLKTWVEKIHQATPNEKNKWKTELTFVPVSEEVGCYYSIKKSKKEVRLEIRCGC